MKKYKTILMKTILSGIILIAILFAISAIMESKAKAASNSNSTSDVQLLARAINGEARGEPYEGQVAVGAVILNRVKSSIPIAILFN